MTDIESSKDDIRTLLLLAQQNRRKAPDETIAYAQRALKLAVEIGSDGFVANAYEWLGIGYINISNYQEALKHLMRSLEINERLGRNRAYAGVLSNIGYIYAELADLDLAQDYYGRAQAIFEGTGDEKGLAGLYSKIGNVVAQRGDRRLAIDYHRKALDLRTRQNDDMGVALALHNIGHNEKKQGALEVAMEHFRKALRIRESIDDKRGVASTSIEIAQILRMRRQCEEALQYAKQAQSISEHAGIRQVLMESWETLSAIQTDLGLHEEALVSHRRFSQMQQQLFGRQASMRIASMQTRWATEQQQREIELLRKDKEILELERRNAALAMAVTASHEMNQPLMILQGNIEMLLSTMPATSDQQQRYLSRIEESLDRIRRILQKFKTAGGVHFEPYNDDSQMVVFSESAQEENS